MYEITYFWISQSLIGHYTYFLKSLWYADELVIDLLSNIFITSFTTLTTIFIPILYKISIFWASFTWICCFVQVSVWCIANIAFLFITKRKIEVFWITFIVICIRDFSETINAIAVDLDQIMLGTISSSNARFFSIWSRKRVILTFTWFA